MTADTAPEIIRLLAHDLRWRLVRELAESDHRVNELVALVGHPLNLVSYHLGQLRRGQIVTTRRSEADGRDTYYSVDLDHLRTLYSAAAKAIHPALAGVGAVGVLTQSPLKLRVLFVCTHNSARSQMAEGLMRHLSGGQIDVSSAGSAPTDVHPDAVHAMNALGIDIRSQRSKGFDDFSGQSFDAVITVCDRAREVCPTFGGSGQQIHWGFSDPAAIADGAERQRAFADIAHRLHGRVRHFLQSAGRSSRDAL